jgi:hypothetical protein
MNIHCAPQKINQKYFSVFSGLKDSLENYQFGHTAKMTTCYRSPETDQLKY